MKQISLPIFVGLVVMLGLACSGQSQGGEMRRCYVLVEGETTTTLVLEDEPARLTVYERKGGRDIAPPQTTQGRLDKDAFVYPDGTRLQLTETTLTWPVDSLLSGAIFTRGACP